MTWWRELSMASRETAVLNAILLKLSRAGKRLFRNNIGVAWYSGKPAKRMANGDVLLIDAVRVAYGVGGEGGSDLIGWDSITVTPEMVGQKLAVFTAIEVKAPGGRVSDEQKNFIEQVNRAGGRGFVAFSADDVE